MAWGMKLVYSLALTCPAKNSIQQKNMESVYPLRVQAIRSRGQNPRLYVSFPLALRRPSLGAWGTSPMGVTRPGRTPPRPAPSSCPDDQSACPKVGTGNHHDDTICAFSQKSCPFPSDLTVGSFNASNALPPGGRALGWPLPDQAWLGCV